ncbi:hypothetical protein STEG23_000921 [Scotinomys teguina]
MFTSGVTNPIAAQAQIQGYDLASPKIHPIYDLLEQGASNSNGTLTEKSKAENVMHTQELDGENCKNSSRPSDSSVIALLADSVMAAVNGQGSQDEAILDTLLRR